MVDIRLKKRKLLIFTVQTPVYEESARSLRGVCEQGLHLRESPRELTREPQGKAGLFSRGSLCSQASLVLI